MGCYEAKNLKLLEEKKNSNIKLTIVIIKKMEKRGNLQLAQVR